MDFVIRFWSKSEDDDVSVNMESAFLSNTRAVLNININILTSIVNSAVQICGKTKGKVKGKETSWWNDRVKEAIKNRNMAKKNTELENRNQNQGLVPKNEHKVTTLEKEYRQKKLQAKRIVEEEKEKSWDIFTQKLEQDSKGNQKLLYGLLKSKRSDREDIKAIETEDRDIIRDMEGIREEMKNSFENLLNGEGVQENETEVIEVEEEQDPISWLETEISLKQMKSGKAAGVDELTADMMKAAGIHGIQWLHRTGVIWEENKVPDEWKKGIIIPLFKKGSRKKCTNYRGITLLPHCLKIMEKSIEKRLRKILEHQLEEQQHGFRNNRGTTDLFFPSVS